MTIVVEPNRLSGLRQAVYVMDCITTGQTREQISKTLGGDTQLVAMWLSFLQHNHWMIEGFDGWAVTTKGAKWSNELARQTKVIS